MQGRLLRKYSEKIIISYDSDGAGQAATLRGLDILTNMGCDVRILQMEGAKDPDEYVIKYGNGRFKLLINDAISLVQFKAKVLKKDLDLQNTNDKIKFLKEIAKLLTSVSSKIEQEIYLTDISKEYGISKEAIYAEINKMTNKVAGPKILSRTPTIRVQKEEVEKKLIEREKAIIAMLINEQEKGYNQIKQDVTIDDLKSETNKKILKKLYEELEKGNSNNISNTLMNFFAEDEEVISRLTELLSEEYQTNNDQKLIDNIVKTYKKEKLNMRKQELIEMQKRTDLTQSEIASIDKEIQDLILKLIKIK
jgi:DNA primase